MPPLAASSVIVVPPDWTSRLSLDYVFGPVPAPGPRRPVEIDLGCGKGRFLLARARAHPEVDFLGLDRLLRRLRKIDRKARRQGLPNVRLLRIEASYALEYLIPPRSIYCFYIFFPDPWPKRRHHRRRLFSVSFMDTLHAALTEGGLVHVATDHLEYGEQIRRGFAADPRFAEVPAFVPSEEEQTDFEREFLLENRPISRCSFRKANRV